MAKEKRKIDEVKWERTHDRDGYDAYRFILSYQGNPVDIVICDNVSHRRAMDQIANLISKKYESTADRPSEKLDQ